MTDGLTDLETLLDQALTQAAGHTTCNRCCPHRQHLAEAIHQAHTQGFSYRRIARYLGMPHVRVHRLDREATT